MKEMKAENERLKAQRDKLLEACKTAIDNLDRLGCQFFACEGPDKPDEDMKTCHVCSAIREIRAAIAECETA